MKKVLLTSLILLFSIFSISALTPCSSIGDNGIITENTTLTDDLYSTGNCLTIGADNIELDCNGHSLQGPGGLTFGIYLQNKQGVTIKNCTIENFVQTIVLDNSSNNIIQNNIFNSLFSIPTSSTGNTILQNTFNQRVSVGGSSNIFEDNDFNYNPTDWDQSLSLSGNHNNFTNNRFNGQGYGTGIYNPMSSQNNTLFNNTIQGFGAGFQICDTYGEEVCGGNVIINNTFLDNGIGIAIGEGNLNTIAYNEVHSNITRLYELRQAKGDFSPITLKDGTMLAEEWGVDVYRSHNNIMWLNNFYNQNNKWDIDNNIYCFNNESNVYNFVINNETCVGDCIIPECGVVMDNDGQWGGPAGGKKNNKIANVSFENILTFNSLQWLGWINYLYADAVEGGLELSTPQGNDTFGWRVYTLPNKYKVSVWKFDSPLSRYMTKSAEYKIYHANGIDTVYVNQASPGDEWIVLGEYTFDNLDLQGVLLSDSGSNGMIIADAVKIESVGPPEY